MASDPNLQVLGAAYIQHKCYSDTAAKKQVTAPAYHPHGPPFTHCPLVPDHPSLIPKLPGQTPPAQSLLSRGGAGGTDLHKSEYPCTHLRTSPYTCMWMHTSLYTCTHLHTFAHICMHLHTSPYTCMSMHTSLYTCICTHTSIYTCIRVHIPMQRVHTC